MVATGMNDDLEVAKGLIEAILTKSANAAWGTLIKVRLDNCDIRPGQVADWPPAGMTLACRRGTEGYVWCPLFDQPDAC